MGCSAGNGITQGTVNATTTTVAAGTAAKQGQVLIAAPLETKNRTRWGYIDAAGKWMIQPQFDLAGDFSEGLAPVLVNDKWGYIDQAGAFVVPPIYEEAYQFQNGLARVATKPSPRRAYVTASGYGWIDKTGTMVLAAQWDDADDFSEGLAPVMKDGLAGFIDARGDLVVPLKFHSLAPLSDGLAAAEMGGKWGYVDKTGNWAVKPVYMGTMGPVNAVLDYTAARYVPVGRFSSGYAPAGRESANSLPLAFSHYIDRTGKKAFSQAYEKVEVFSEGLAGVRVGAKWGFIDSAGKMVIAPQYAGIPATPVTGLIQFHQTPGFQEGLAVASTDRGTGYIDTTGKFVIEPRFMGAQNFHNGFAYVGIAVSVSTWQVGVINRAGEVIYRATPSPIVSTGS